MNWTHGRIHTATICDEDAGDIHVTVRSLRNGFNIEVVDDAGHGMTRRHNGTLDSALERAEDIALQIQDMMLT